MTRGVLSAEAVRRLAKKGNRVQASSKVGFQLIKYPDNQVREFPERMEGAAMIDYIGFQPETAQKLWRTYYPDAQKHVHGSLDLYAHAKTYLTRKFEEHKHRRPKDLLAAAGLAADLVQSLIDLVQRISISQRFKLNKVSSHDLRDWAIIKIKKKFYQMKFLDAQILNPSSWSKIGLGMFPLSLKKGVVPGQIVAISGKPVADGFYVEKDGKIMPGWKGGHLNNIAIKPVRNYWLAKFLPVQR